MHRHVASEAGWPKHQQHLFLTQLSNQHTQQTPSKPSCRPRPAPAQGRRPCTVAPWMQRARCVCVWERGKELLGSRVSFLFSQPTLSFPSPQQTLTDQGIRGIYRGMGAPLATVALFNAVLFSARGRMEALLAHADGTPLTVVDRAVAGLGAGVAVSFLATPTELIKCRLQSQLSVAQAASQAVGNGAPVSAALAGTPPAAALAAAATTPTIRHRGPLDVVRHVWAHERGVLGLFRGLTPTLAREVPGNAVMFGVYEALKQGLASAQGLMSTSELGGASLVLAGGAAGTAFWIPVFPADVVKSRWQVDVPGPTAQYSGVLDCARRTVASGGVKALYRGFAPAMVRAFPANAVCFLAYEVAAKAMTGAVAGG